MSVRFTLAALLALTLTSASPAAENAARPNVVFILTDNQSAWTLGCYGNKEIRTPSIDRLAREGTLFTRCFSSNAVCSPTRATYLTGLMPSQHGIHSYLRAGGAQMGPKAHCTIAEFRSLPQILAEAGYVCGLSGKWHLGGNLTPQAGFTYWVTTPHGHTTTFHGADVIENGKVRKEPAYLTDFWTDRGVAFIEKNKDRPFFLFLAYNGPYGLGASMKQPPRNRHAEHYAGKMLPSMPVTVAHPWMRANEDLFNNLVSKQRYAAEISGVDDGVGRVMETLAKHGLDERTLVVFTADQGLCAGHHGIWGMGDHTRPLSAFDEMIHVPLIWRHKDAAGVRAGQRSDLLVSNYDFLPTVLEYVGLTEKTPMKPALPGRSYVGALSSEPPRDWTDATFFEFENTRAIRTTTWKYVQRFPDGPEEMYDLGSDPSESTNLATREAHVDVKQRLSRRLDEFFHRYADPKYDLKHGGTSKTPLHPR